VENIEIRASHSKKANVSGTRRAVNSGSCESTLAQTKKNSKVDLLAATNPTRGDKPQPIAPRDDVPSRVSHPEEDADDDASCRPV
jgi:hypothetical protein